ncbi:MAG: hypothetical protein AAGA58_16940 [Verrucomicrobiota bacterium]
MAHAGDKEALLEMIMDICAGIPVQESYESVADLPTTARTPNFGYPYHMMVVEPLLGPLAYLLENDFKPSSYPVAASFSSAFSPKKHTKYPPDK